jgi:hypothetical protein
MDGNRSVWEASSRRSGLSNRHPDCRRGRHSKSGAADFTGKLKPIAPSPAPGFGGLCPIDFKEIWRFIGNGLGGSATFLRPTHLG